MDLEVVRVDRTTVEVPYRPVQARNMHRQWPSWKYFEVCEVELGCGAVGHGETMLFYGFASPPGYVEDADVERATGANAATLMWDDSLKPGLQIALFDAVGRALEVPVHALLGEQVRERTSLSWWCNDMPAEDWAAECEAAIEAGYTNIKLKGRPWFDIYEQIDRIHEVTPPEFGVDIDFNSTLLDAERGLPILEEIETYPQVEAFEGPIPFDDIEGYRTLREQLDSDIVRHYGADTEQTICEGLCDGLVVSGGATRATERAAVAAMADMPFFIQHVGTGITGAWTLHLAAVCSHARWPTINCFQLFEDDLLVDSIAVENGTASVPDAPGLGHEVDTGRVEELAVETPETEPQPPRLMRAHWPREDTVMYFAEGQQMPDTAREAEMPYYQRDATASLIPDDGSAAWADLRERALAAPVTVSAADAPF